MPVTLMCGDARGDSALAVEPAAAAAVGVVAGAVVAAGRRRGCQGQAIGDVFIVPAG